MTKTKRILAVILAVVMLLALAAGCGSKKDEGSTLTASGQPYSHTLPVWLAQKDGMFEDAGIDFELLMFTGGAPQNEALGAGEWDIGTMGSPPSITGGLAYDVKVIGFGSTDSSAVSIWARPDSDVAQISGEVEGYPDIKGNADTWRGKTILCPTSTSAHFTLVATLQAMGLTGDDVNIIDMGVAQAYTAFKAGEADIVCLWDPQGFYAEDEGWTQISSGEATGQDMPTVIVAPQSAIDEKYDEILEYLDFYFQETEKYSQDLEAYAQAMMDIGLENGLDQTFEVAHMAAEKRPLPTLDDEIEYFSTDYAETTMENLMDFFIYTGTITEEDKQTLIDNGFVDSRFIEALAERYNKDF